MHSSTTTPTDIVALIQEISVFTVAREADLSIRHLLRWLRGQCHGERALFYQFEGPLLARCVTDNVDQAWARHCQEQQGANDPIIVGLREAPGFLSWQSASERFAASERHTSLVKQCSLAPGLAYGCLSEGAAPRLTVVSVNAHPQALSQAERYQLSSLALLLHLIDARAPRAPSVLLTDKEQQVLRWARAGKTCWETAKILGISQSTVNFHFKSIFRKLGVTNRTQAVGEALSLDLLG